MPKMINEARFIKTKTEVAGILERWREDQRKNKKDFAALLGITGEAYNHISQGKTYPSFRVLSILSQNGFNIASLLNLDDKDVEAIRAGKYDE